MSTLQSDREAQIACETDGKPWIASKCAGYGHWVKAASAVDASYLKEIEELKNQLHRDQTGLAGGLAAINEYLKGCDWITQGRGSYEWDDDRYRDESHQAFAEIRRLATEALHKSGKEAHAICCHSALEQLAAKDALLEKARGALRMASGKIWNGDVDIQGVINSTLQLLENEGKP